MNQYQNRLIICSLGTQKAKRQVSRIENVTRMLIHRKRKSCHSLKILSAEAHDFTLFCEDMPQFFSLSYLQERKACLHLQPRKAKF